MLPNLMFVLKGNDSKDKFTFIWTLFSTFVSCNLLCWLYIFLIILCWNVYLNPRPKRKTTPTLSIHQWNLNSICAHNFEQLSVLKVYMSAHKIDIICLSETYLDFSIDEKAWKFQETIWYALITHPTKSVVDFYLL